jgi:hypothetical protein
MPWLIDLAHRGNRNRGFAAQLRECDERVDRKRIIDGIGQFGERVPESAAAED